MYMSVEAHKALRNKKDLVGSLKERPRSFKTPTQGSNRLLTFEHLSEAALSNLIEKLQRLATQHGDGGPAARGILGIRGVPLGHEDTSLQHHR